MRRKTLITVTCAGIFEITIGKSYYLNWPKDMLNIKSSMMKDRNRNTTFTNIPILRKKWGIFSKNEAGTYNFSIHICLCDEVILGLYHKFWGFNHGMKGWNYLGCYIDMPFLLLTFDHELHMSSLTFVINMVHFKQINWHVQSLACTCLPKITGPLRW